MGKSYSRGQGWRSFNGTDYVHQNEGSIMRNCIDIDRTHSRAISREIGERLGAYLREEPELPASFRKQVDRLRELEGQAPPIVPTVPNEFEDKAHKDVSRGDQSWFTWWRRRMSSLQTRVRSR